MKQLVLMNSGLLLCLSKTHIDDKGQSGCNCANAHGAVSWGDGGFPEPTHPLVGSRWIENSELLFSASTGRRSAFAETRDARAGLEHYVK